jgi:hypothetical protein
MTTRKKTETQPIQPTQPTAAEIAQAISQAWDKQEQAPDDFPGILIELSQPIDPSRIRQREGWRDRNGNVHMVDYIEWHEVANILDRVCPRWSFEVKEMRVIGQTMVMTVRLTIEGVSREGVGCGHADTEMGIKKAEHDALKRAAVKFGIARELYYKEELSAPAPQGQYVQYDTGQQRPYDGQGQQQPMQQAQGQRQFTNPTEFPTNPVATSLGDLISAKQIGMVKAIAREAGIDIDAEVARVMRCGLSELNKRAASALIGHLQDLASGGIGYPPIAPAQQFTGQQQQFTGQPMQSPGVNTSVGERITQPMINALRILIHNHGLTEDGVTFDQTNGRVQRLEDLTGAEAFDLQETLKMM